MIYGNEASDSKIEFEYYSASLNKYFDIQETIEFSPDMIVGDALNPFELLEDTSDEMLSSYSLDRAYPNPFNPTTTINYTVGDYGFVNITVYDISGRVVEKLVSEYQNQGEHSIVWNAGNLPSGLYFVNLDANGHSSNQKLMLVK